jgi:phosphotriesterase-related protein
VGLVQTVLGPVPARELGYTQPHEHLLVDVSAQYGVSALKGYCQTAGLGDRKIGGREQTVAEAFMATAKRQMPAPIRPDNYDWIRRYGFNWDNVRLVDVGEATREMAWYRAAGGRSVVDSTPRGVGRNPEGLVAISRETGVKIVMGCGWYTYDVHPPFVSAATEDELFCLICSDILEGEETAGVRAGIIGEIGLSWPVHSEEAKVLRAAVRAQTATGAALQIHPGRDAASPMEALKTVRESGGRCDRTIMSHVERTLLSLDSMLELAETGCYLEFDLFGQESSFYPWAPIDLPNDARRIDLIRGLADAGHLRQVLLSQDIYQKVHWRQYGGAGYAHILDNVIPVMYRKGFDEREVAVLTVENPAQILALQEMLT